MDGEKQMKYKERRPNYFTGWENGQWDVDSFEKLAKTDSVAGRFTRSEKFLRFSWSNGYTDEYPYSLMAEMTDGTFWVTGYISDKLDLPHWNYDECMKRKEMINKENETTGET